MSDFITSLPMSPAVLVPYVAAAASQIANSAEPTLLWALSDAEQTLAAELTMLQDGEGIDLAPPVAALRGALGPTFELSTITLQSVLASRTSDSESPASERQVRIQSLTDVIERLQAAQNGSVADARDVEKIFSSAVHRLVGSGGTVDIF